MVRPPRPPSWARRGDRGGVRASQEGRMGDHRADRVPPVEAGQRGPWAALAGGGRGSMRAGALAAVGETRFAFCEVIRSAFVETRLRLRRPSRPRRSSAGRGWASAGGRRPSPNRKPASVEAVEPAPIADIPNAAATFGRGPSARRANRPASFLVDVRLPRRWRKGRLVWPRSPQEPLGKCFRTGRSLSPAVDKLSHPQGE